MNNTLNIRLFSIGLFLFTFLFEGCVKNSPPTVLKPVELNGINGLANYYFHPETRLVEQVIKTDFYLPLKYKVYINRDTLKIGESFKGFMGAYSENFSVFLESPELDTIKGGSDTIKKDFILEEKVYTYKVLNEGVYLFKGRIEYDTVSIHFEYKFLVLPN